MKKLLLFVVSAIMLVPASVKADEGMWFLMFIERLNHRDMQKMGLQLTAEEIYSINNHSLKDAIVQFNGGCTAEMISKDGLVLTNHHCGYDAIAELSSAEKTVFIVFSAVLFHKSYTLNLIHSFRQRPYICSFPIL